LLLLHVSTSGHECYQNVDRVDRVPTASMTICTGLRDGGGRWIDACDPLPGRRHWSLILPDQSGRRSGQCGTIRSTTNDSQTQ